MNHRTPLVVRLLPTAFPLVLPLLGLEASAQIPVRVYQRAVPGIGAAVAGGGYHDRVSNLVVVGTANNDLREWHGAGVSYRDLLLTPCPLVVCEYSPDPGKGFVWGPTCGTWLFAGNAVWSSLASPGTPLPATASVGRRLMQWDAARDQAVLLVENTAPAATQAFKFTGFWQAMPLPPGSDRFGGMVYDPGRGGVVALTDAGAFLWDDVAWNAVPPPGGPYLTGRALAFDASRQRLVAFGGANGSTSTAGTLEWDGTQWLTMTPPAAPTARRGATFVYDPVRQECMLFGGVTSGTTTVDDVWAWNGTTWRNDSAPTTQPPALREAMAAEIAPGTILFGGIDAAGVTRGETWRFDGAAWSLLSTPNAPSPRSSAAMAAIDANTILLFGGRAANGTVLADTWQYTASGGWVQSPQSPQTPRQDAAMASDGAGRAWLFGGNNGGTVLGDLMVLASPGSGWQYVANALFPREKCGLVYQPTRNRLLAFGGRNAQNPGLGATEEIDVGTYSYSLPALAHEPTTRIDFMMTWDPLKNRVVVAGGYDPTQNFAIGDLYEWDGTVWQVAHYAPEFARIGAASCYQRASDRMLMFGGQTTFGGAPTSATWEVEQHAGPALLQSTPYAGLQFTGLPVTGAHQAPLRVQLAAANAPSTGIAVLFLDTQLLPQPFPTGPTPLFCSSQPVHVSPILGVLGSTGDPSEVVFPLPPVLANTRLFLQGITLESSLCLNATEPVFVRVRSL